MVLPLLGAMYGGCVIDIQGLGFRYSGAAHDTLQDINLQVPAGSVFGLLGPNGAGKSTLLNILCGLLHFETGKVHIDGLCVRRQSHLIKPFSALVPQDFAFYPQLTAMENLRFFARVLGLRGQGAKNEITRCIAIAQLEKHAHTRAAVFSGGLKRRLNLAIGLLSQPRLIFLDEPTVGVDAQSRHFLLQSIRELNREHGVTVVYTSHYMEEVQFLCDQVAIIDHGRICLAGPLQELLQSHSQLLKVRVKQLPTPDFLQQLRRHWPQMQLDDPGTLTLSDSDAEAVAALLKYLQAQGLQVCEISYGSRNRLEDIFLDTTQRQLRD